MSALGTGEGSDGKCTMYVLSLVSVGMQSCPEVLLKMCGDVYIYINHAFQFLCWGRRKGKKEILSPLCCIIT